MPFEYLKDSERRRVTVRVTGSLTADKAARIADRHSDEDVWGYALVYDLTDVAKVPTREEVQQIADYVQRKAERRPRGPVAIIAPNAALFGLARMYAAFAGPAVPLNVFHNRADAERWLRNASD